MDGFPTFFFSRSLPLPRALCLSLGRRFSEFDELNSELKMLYPGKPLSPPFPAVVHSCLLLLNVLSLVSNAKNVTQLT
jgi:hypothetical protein